MPVPLTLEEDLLFTIEDIIGTDIDELMEDNFISTNLDMCDDKNNFVDEQHATLTKREKHEQNNNKDKFEQKELQIEIKPWDLWTGKTLTCLIVPQRRDVTNSFQTEFNISKQQFPYIGHSGKHCFCNAPCIRTRLPLYLRKGKSSINKVHGDNKIVWDATYHSLKRLREIS